jgi:hypothetical protein
VKTYILFLFGEFNDFDDIEYFCVDVLGESNKINQVKYIIQNLNAIIVIMDSEESKEVIVKELESILDNENILFYFCFERSGLFLTHLPDNMKDIIFKPKFSDANIVSEIKIDEFDLDTILDKIKNEGIDSLTSSERKFLDDYNI